MGIFLDSALNFSKANNYHSSIATNPQGSPRGFMHVRYFKMRGNSREGLVEKGL